MGAKTEIAQSSADVRPEAGLPTSMSGWRDAWIGAQAKRFIEGRAWVDGDRLAQDRIDEAKLAIEDGRWAEDNLHRAALTRIEPPPEWRALETDDGKVWKANTAVRHIPDPVRARMAAAEAFDLMPDEQRKSSIATMVHLDHGMTLIETHTGSGDSRTEHLMACRLLGQGGGGAAFVAAKPQRGFEGFDGLDGSPAPDLIVPKGGKIDLVGTNIGPSTEPMLSAGRNSAHARQTDAQAIVWMPVAERRQWSSSLGRDVVLTSDIHGNERGACVPRKTELSFHPAHQRDLESVLGQRCTVEDSARMTCQMLLAADSLRDSNGRPMVHRDIKPANILVSWNEAKGRVEFSLVDFGLAARQDQMVKPWEGTSTHRAPEQRVAFDPVRRRADKGQWRSFDGKTDSAAILACSYEMLSGQTWRSTVETTDPKTGITTRITPKELEGALDIQADFDSGHRPMPIPAAFAGDDEASRSKRQVYQAWELMIAAGADRDEAARTPPVGVLAQAQAYLAPQDRDVLSADDLKRCAAWLDRADRGPHADRVAALDRAAIHALLADDRLDGEDRQRLGQRLVALQNVTPTVSTDFLSKAHAQDLQNQDKLLARWGGQSVARMVDHRDVQSRISLEEFKSRSASATADRARSEQESVRRASPEPPPDEPPRRDDFRM